MSFPGAPDAVPPFPSNVEWVGGGDPGQAGRSLLVEFWDSARINSLRTLPYLKAWHERYADLGIDVVGVHSPGYSFGRDPDLARRAIVKLEIPYRVVLDPALEVWRLYRNRGWPARYLFDGKGMLRHMHYGEGEYEATEFQIQALLAEGNPGRSFPAPLDPIRPEDAPGVTLDPQTADITLPADRERLELVRDWIDGPDYIEAADAGAGATATFRAGGAWVVLSGDDGDPGLSETDGTVVADSPGLRVHGFQFTPTDPLSQ